MQGFSPHARNAEIPARITEMRKNVQALFLAKRKDARTRVPTSF
jgi:hypothetical protein